MSESTEREEKRPERRGEEKSRFEDTPSLVYISNNESMMKMMYQPSQNAQNHPDNDASDGRAMGESEWRVV